MIDDAILTAIADRLADALAAPRQRYRPLTVDGHAVGFLDEGRATRLAAFRDVFVTTRDGLRFVPTLADCTARTNALDAVTRTLAGEGRLTRWRDELYPVTDAFGPRPLFLIERAAARYFGIRTRAAHVNGVVLRDGAERLWIARRSPTKPIDPGMLDNMVGGGIAHGLDVRRTVVKEAFEEAGIPEHLAIQARPVAQLSVCREQPDGLQIETVYAHDLALPPGFVPQGQDGEVADWRLLDVRALARVLARTAPPEVMTADASLVTVDWLLRRGYIDERREPGARLAALRIAPDPATR